jgi:hypothetical protein
VPSIAFSTVRLPVVIWKAAWAAALASERTVFATMIFWRTLVLSAATKARPEGMAAPVVRALIDACPVPSPPVSLRQILAPGVATWATGVVPSTQSTMAVVVPAGVDESTCTATGWAQFEPSTVKATSWPTPPVADTGLMARLGGGCGVALPASTAATICWYRATTSAGFTPGVTSSWKPSV